MELCNFNEAYIGKCENKKPCKEHSKKKCCECGKPATKSCSNTNIFVCGYPLCNNCRHKH